MVLLAAAGCMSDDDEACARYSETYELNGEIKLARGVKSVLGEKASAPIVLQVFEDSSVVSCSGSIASVSSPGRMIDELVISGPGAFEWDLSVEGYAHHRPDLTLSAFLDSNEDGSCTPGELFAASGFLKARAKLKLELKPGQTCLRRI